MKITVFDTETTGIFPRGDKSPLLANCPYIVQFSSIVYDTNTHSIVDSINDIIRLPESITIPESAIAVHKITNESMRKVGTPLELTLTAFNKQLEETNVLLAHNLEFDAKIVECEFERCNEKSVMPNIPASKRYCTMKEGTNLCKIKTQYGYKWPKLEELHYHLFGTKLKNLHDAYHDIVICLRCYMFMNYQIDIAKKNEEIRQTIKILECI